LSLNLKNAERVVFMKSLKSKMLVIIIPIVILAFGAVSFISYYFAKNIITKDANDNLNQTSQASANEINGWLAMHLEMIDGVRETVEKTSPTPEMELSYLKYMVDKYESISDLYIGTVDGKMIDGSGWIPPNGYDPRQRDWYQEGINNDKIEFTKPYLDKATNQMVVAAAVKIKRPDGNGRGVFSGDVSLKSITELVKQIKYGKTGYGYLVENNDGTIIAHNDSKIITKKLGEIEDGSLKELKERVISGKTGNYSYL
jgi:methyl-accepting chemotaxis protein